VDTRLSLIVVNWRSIVSLSPRGFSANALAFHCPSVTTPPGVRSLFVSLHVTRAGYWEPELIDRSRCSLH